MSAGRPDSDGLIRKFSGFSSGGGLERPTVTFSDMQLIALPHTRSVAVVDLGPVCYPDRGADYHNKFREGVDQYAAQFRISRDEAVTLLARLGLESLGYPTKEWLEANP